MLKNKHWLSKKSVLIAFLAIVYSVLVDAFLLTRVWAHPHIFIVQRLNIVFDDKGLVGINVWWRFDDMFSSMVAEDYDLNRNGKLEAEEIQLVRKNAFDLISEFNYFTHIKIDNKPFEVKYIKNFNAILENKRLTYEFFIPCRVTATKQFKKITIASYDPTYYTAIFYAQKESVSLTAADAFEVKAPLRKDPDTKIYFDMIHPWTLFLEFRRRP